MPSMLPLNITIKWGKIRGSNTANILSKVTYKTIESLTDLDKQYLSTMAQIKAVALKEIHLQHTHRFSDIVDDVTRNINSEDIIITYNSDLYNEFSFSIDDVMCDKYDFVSLAIRDIAKGLGFGINITANNQKIVFPTIKKPYYESCIWNALVNETPASAYTKCTQGHFDVFGLPSLYAPNPWSNGVSLQYYIPEETDPLSMLLSYDFGKGYVMRDLSGVDWEYKFQSILDWQAMMTVGESTSSKNETGSTDNNISYNGSIDLSSLSSKNIVKTEDPKLSSKEASFTKATQSNSTSYYDLCQPYNYFYTGEKNVYFGYSISALLKNGNWDVLYAEYSPTTTTIRIEDLNLNYPDYEYARSCSGGLRYRITKCVRNGNPLTSPSAYYVKYFTRDYLPQKANIKYSRIHEETETTNSKSARMSDDYFVDVEIGLSHIEGTTKIIVEQLDEGERVPFRYEAENFRQGYFIANLDRELSTQLTVISYNENGSTKSETITIPAIGYENIPQNISFNLADNYIEPIGIDNSRSNIYYSITNLTINNRTKDGLLPQNGKIDILDLQPGFYVLSLKNGDQISNYKFSK